MLDGTGREEELFQAAQYLLYGGCSTISLNNSNFHIYSALHLKIQEKRKNPEERTENKGKFRREGGKLKRQNLCCSVMNDFLRDQMAFNFFPFLMQLLIIFCTAVVIAMKE